jgi:type I restriction enzyme, S subunit
MSKTQTQQNGWIEYKFSEFVQINPRTELKSGKVYSFVEMKNLNENRKKVYSTQTRKLKGGSRFVNGDTLFARITPCLENGKICQVDELVGDKGFGSTEFLIFREREKISYSDFIYYVSRWREVRDFAELNMSGTSGRQRVSKTAFNELILELPPLPEQKAIAEVLSSLDDKIDLLHHQNKTLEDMAQALFRKWFVDNPERKKWEEKKIGDVLEIKLGGTPSTTKPEYWNGDISWINSGEINKFRIFEPTKYITKLGLEKSATKLLPKGSTVIAITGATLGQVSLLEMDTCANQSVVGIIPNDNLSKEFVYLWIKKIIKELISNQTGGAQQHINKNDVNDSLIVIPTKDLLIEKNHILENIFNKISENISQTHTLENMCDTLLPKLMSGAVRVKLN